MAVRTIDERLLRVHPPRMNLAPEVLMIYETADMFLFIGSYSLDIYSDWNLP